MEEIIQQAQSLLSSGYGLAGALVGIVTLLFKAITSILRALDLHDKHFVRKRLIRLKALRSSAAKNQGLAQYLDQAIELETFRIASGVTTSPAKMEFLLKLARDGVWSREQIRSVSKFLAVEPGSPTPLLQITKLDRTGAYLGITAALSTIAVGGVHLLQFILTGKPLLSLLGLLIFAVLILVGRFFATDFIDYQVVKRAQLHLQRTEQSA